MIKAAFYTLGCKVNQYETEAMSEIFKKAGYEITDFSEKSDIYVINTCSVTNMGDRKSRQIIHRAKKTNPDSVIIVTGCYAQTAPDEILSIDGVNLVLGTHDRRHITELAKGLTSSSKVNAVGDIMKMHTFEELSIDSYTDRTRAYIKIQDGCSQFCSYCIIPYARGPIRSRKEERIIDEANKLAQKGFSEIILVGIHVASYGTDLNTSLEELLLKADAVEGVQRIRLSSIEPMTLDNRFINKVKISKKLCPHFHISLQSGCDETLKRMNRHYTTQQYAKITDNLRAAFPDVSITTDIMVGFPGETDEEFGKTVDFVKQMHFSDAHVFMYSPRRGTPAAKRPDQIPPQIKEKRSKEIISVINKSRREFLKSFTGRIMEVLFEQPVGEYFEGKTSNYINVKVKTHENLQGIYRNVLLEDVTDNAVIGTLL